MLTFLCATYNEEDELPDLLESVGPFVDAYAICDDGSTDQTPKILGIWHEYSDKPFNFKLIDHTGLPETVKNEALSLVETDWVLMLDCDERISGEILADIVRWLSDKESETVDYVYFRQIESLDGKAVREFQKCKLFRKEAIRFPLQNIHADDQFVGNGTYRKEWIVEHRKTTHKQIMREQEYLETYKNLLESGHIDEGRYTWLRNLHHFVKG